jgi:hypothetical protein
MVEEALVEQEAAKRGLSRDALFEAETRASEIPVSDQVEAAYRRIRHPGEDEAAVKRQLAARIRQARVKPTWEKFLKSLKARATITIHLRGPDGKPATLDID